MFELYETDEPVADLAGINAKTLCANEEGTRMIKLDTLYKLSKIYDISIDAFIEKSWTNS